MNRYINIIVGLVVGIYIGSSFMFLNARKQMAKQAILQERQIFESYAINNYGTMVVEASGKNMDEAIHNLDVKTSFLLENQWSMVGEVSKIEGIGKVSVSRVAIRFP